eukprot:1161967-Pelagomonas_calceolata.AAC.8
MCGVRIVEDTKWLAGEIMLQPHAKDNTSCHKNRQLPSPSVPILVLEGAGETGTKEHGRAYAYQGADAYPKWKCMHTLRCHVRIPAQMRIFADDQRMCAEPCSKQVSPNVQVTAASN